MRTQTDINMGIVLHAVRAASAVAGAAACKSVSNTPVIVRVMSHDLGGFAEVLYEEIFGSLESAISFCKERYDNEHKFIIMDKARKTINRDYAD